MRQGNSNKRMRGRGGGGGGGGGNNNGGRKGPNPLNRSYESAGPDNTKIRGTALHVAEKYVSLARDAQSSGDPVLAENFLQHAEHYYRIIAAAQANMPQPMPIVRSDIQVDEDEEDFDEAQAEAPRGEGRQQETRPQVGDDGFMALDTPQPFLDDMPSESRDRNRMREDRPRLDRGERNDRGDRNERGRGRFRNGTREDRPDQPRDGNRFEGQRPPRGERPQRVEIRAEEAEADLAALPAFLTATPTRAVAPAPVEVEIEAPIAAPAPVEVAEVAADDAAPKRRTRGGRGRGRRPEYEAGEKAEDTAPVPAED